MNDKRLLDIRFRAENDPRLSKGARWLMTRLVSEKYMDSHFICTEEFPLPHSEVSRLTFVCEKQAYRYLKELQSRLYIRFEALKTSPATKFFKFVFFEPKQHREVITANHTEAKKVRAERATRAMKRAVATPEKAGRFTKRKSWDD
jgi:hypothetical protein